MAKARQIVKRLKAVRNIRKITRTMELIATARFKRAMDRATEAEAYTRKISEIVADLSQLELEFTHPLLKAHDTEDNAVLLIITSNRGFAGGYNASVIREAQQRIREAKAAGQNLSVEVSGKRGINFLKFQKQPVDRTYRHFEDKPAFDEVDELAARYVESYVRGKIDRLDVAYMKLVSASRQVPICERLLPVGTLAGADRRVEETNGRRIEYEFLPSAREILEEIVPAAFKARLFKCFLDAAVSEQIFRMVAMKGATENAQEMISNLSQRYNRARQQQITSELAEVIGGAAALE
ncbi:MAG: ATP synthase F1 subunit gamma [Planctomycetes bacterium]|nr:ATP synthase F1 subunit gamma [Planctomycetota bacterium]